MSNITAPVTIRLYSEDANGALDDMEEDRDLADFGGVVPAAGDIIFNPFVLHGVDRNNPQSRTIYEVKRRIFNARDTGGAYIVLVLKERPLTVGEVGLMP